MRAYDDFIRRIVSHSGIVTSRGRRDLEQELRDHLEDAIEEARSQGHDEAGTLPMVYDRFGDPGEIARDIAFAHRFERRGIIAARSLALMCISMFTVASLILALQLLVAVCSGISPPDAFPYWREETVAFGSLTLGYTGLYLGELLFQERRLIKSVALNCVLFAVLFTLTSLTMHVMVLPSVLTFVCGVAARVLQQTVIRPAWFLGTAAPIAVAGLLGGHIRLGPLALVQWTGITVACYCLTLLSRHHQRRMLDFDPSL